MLKHMYTSADYKTMTTGTCTSRTNWYDDCEVVGEFGNSSPEMTNLKYSDDEYFTGLVLTDKKTLSNEFGRLRRVPVTMSYRAPGSTWGQSYDWSRRLP